MLGLSIKTEHTHYTKSSKIVFKSEGWNSRRVEGGRLTEWGDSSKVEGKGITIRQPTETIRRLLVEIYLHKTEITWKSTSRIISF